MGARIDIRREDGREDRGCAGAEDVVWELVGDVFADVEEEDDVSDSPRCHKGQQNKRVHLVVSGKLTHSRATGRALRR